MKVLLVSKGCPTCQAIKKKGACKSNKCVEISSKTGYKIANEGKVKYIPQCVKLKNGKWVKCDTGKIIKKYVRR